VAVFLLCLPLTFATWTNDTFTLFVGPPEVVEETAERLTEIEIETSAFEDAELQTVAFEQPEFNMSDSILPNVTPLDSLAPSSTERFGQVDSLPGDLGTLMAGAGEPDGGKASGSHGSANFFGTRSQGDRFVFVIDNSSSMKNGRLEAAIAELVTCVKELSRRQSFYVLFVSDQTYPMFYPETEPALVLATEQNKKRLGEWLTRVRLASGKNRELIKAMDLAASLQPQAVFLLWDGTLHYNERVRQDVMTHLTRPKQWTFTIHTLGMGIESLDSEFNLRSIAQAHGGVYRQINVPSVLPRK
jgi:hypothetical protein